MAPDITLLHSPSLGLNRNPRNMMAFHQPRTEKEEGSIGNSFASLAKEKETLLPERYLDLKRQIIGDKSNQKALIAAWARLTSRLAELAEEIDQKQQQTIPETTYNELVSSPSPELIRRIRECGSLVIHGTVSQEQAAKWLDDVKDYIKLNLQVKGFPEDDKQVFEIYWSKAQQEARSHPQMLKTQSALLSIFTPSHQSEVSLSTPLVYSDRLRIRKPGDAKFALGPHMDGGSIERWEDPVYCSVYEKILTGRWEEFDAWELEKRALARHDLYPGPGSTGPFRSWQGWTSLSETGPMEGTLLVYPFIREHSAYVLMRPLFKPKNPKSHFKDRNTFLAPDNWELDLETTNFPGAPPYRNQELNDDTHPHLELFRSMVAMPKVYPGDSVWWHTDVIHAVEAEHRGINHAAAFYIPAVALSTKNAKYIRDQRETLFSGRPAPDFPGGIGESEFQCRGTGADLLTLEAKEGMGLLPFRLNDELSAEERSVRQAANSILGF